MTGSYQFKITLLGAKPPIWRRCCVPADYTLKQLHTVIQCVFEWADYHLFAFECHGQRLDNQIPGALDRTLHQLALIPQHYFTYYYDFGDDWIHRLLVEKFNPNKYTSRPHCLAGKRAAPPEDAGGVGGYEMKRNVLMNPAHPDYDAVLEWMGDSDLDDTCAVERINQRLNETMC